MPRAKLLNASKDTNEHKVVKRSEDKYLIVFFNIAAPFAFPIRCNLLGSCLRTARTVSFEFQSSKSFTRSYKVSSLMNSSIVSLPLKLNQSCHISNFSLSRTLENGWGIGGEGPYSEGWKKHTNLEACTGSVWYECWIGEVCGPHLLSVQIVRYKIFFLYIAKSIFVNFFLLF